MKDVYKEKKYKRYYNLLNNFEGEEIIVILVEKT